MHLKHIWKWKAVMLGTDSPAFRCKSSFATLIPGFSLQSGLDWTDSQLNGKRLTPRSASSERDPLYRKR